MARKKVSHAHQEKPSQRQEEPVKADGEVVPSMDSKASEKIESLKSLNQMLLKETFERRQQVDSLVQAKWSLQSELIRSNSEREALRSEMTLLGERAERLELERAVVSVFVASQAGLRGEEFERKIEGLKMKMREFKREIEEKQSEILRLNLKLSDVEEALGSEREFSRRVLLERDGFQDKLNLQMEEGKRFRERLIEVEGTESTIEREIGELRTSYNAVIGENEEMKKRIKSFTVEKESTERVLVESNKVIEQMKEELGVIVMKKEVAEEERSVQMAMKQELENVVIGLNETVVNSQKKELKLRTILAELEKKCFEGEERHKEMERKIDELVEEKKLGEKIVLGLIDEKTAVQIDLAEAMRQLAEKKEKIEEMVNERIVITETKCRLDNEVADLEKQVAELRAVVFKLEESNTAHDEKIEALESEVGEYKCRIKQVDVEREGIEHYLAEEKENAMRLKERIGGFEIEIEESQKKAGEVKTEKDAIFAEKIELESRCEMLNKEVASLRKTIVEGKDELNSMKRKVELAGANSELMLKMLKDTTSSCSVDRSDGGVCELTGYGDEMKPHVAEMRMIKDTVRSKVKKVEEMKMQVDCLKNSVEGAHKMKTFCTVLSSATTLLAAISLAYAFRGH